MGRKKLGGGGGASTKRPGGSHGSGLVVVNPMLMQSALRQNASLAAKPAAVGKKRKAQVDAAKQQQHHKANKQQKKLKQQSPGNGANSNSNNSSNSSNSASKANKRPPKSAVVTTTVQSAVTGARDDADNATRRTPIALLVAREEQLLAGAYWVALSRAAKRSSVVVVPNNHAALTPQSVAGALRHLGFQAVAIHKKMTPGQRKESVERLAGAARLVSEASQLLLVTTEHFAGATVCADADVVLVNVAAQEAFGKFAAVFQVSVNAGGGAATSYRPELTSALMQQLAARLKLATQITEITQRLGQASAKDVDAKWANKLARGADLGGDDDDDGTAAGAAADNNDDDGGGRGKKKKKAPSPDEQRLQALTEKLALLIARRLETAGSKKRAGGGDKEAAASPAADNQNGREKLEALGIVTLSASVGAALTDERFSAQTRWMDAASGRQHGGEWDGDVRHGASKDAASLALRRTFCTHLQSHKRSPNGASSSSSPATRLLHEWKPNRNPADVDKWGGEFGKACGHNEVVMQSLRPFFPQEVLNSRVCSRLFPAPGNQGFDGCLEHLRLQCAAQQRAMTLWDAECFVFISRAGHVTWARKNQLLRGLSLASLQCLVANLRSWTLASRGEVAPGRVLQALQLCCALGGGELAAPRLEAKLLKRVMSFAVSGSARLWKQIARVPALESEVVYAG